MLYLRVYGPSAPLRHAGTELEHRGTVRHVALSQGVDGDMLLLAGTLTLLLQRRFATREQAR